MDAIDAFLRIENSALAYQLAQAFAVASSAKETAVIFAYLKASERSLAEPARYFSEFRSGNYWRRGAWKQLKHGAKCYVAYRNAA